MGKIKSKAKGAKGERELSRLLKEYGYDTRRSQQYCGANGDADVVGLPGIYIECKRVQKLNIYEAMDQAINDSSANDLPFGYDLPTVFHRKNKCEWLVTMRYLDFLEIYAGGNTKIAYLYRKVSERTCLYDWIEKASDEAKKHNCAFPYVLHRKKDYAWLVTMRFSDWIDIYREWETLKALEQEETR